MVISVIVMAGDHLQSRLYFPIMTVILFVTMAMGVCEKVPVNLRFLT